MDYRALKELIQECRTVRRFKPNITIDKNDLVDIVDTVRVTSSALNKQPLRYVVVTEEEMVHDLTARAKWASHLAEWEQQKDERPSAYIVIVNDTSVDGYELIDTGIVLQSILLLLGAKGYAGCPLASIDKEHCKELFFLGAGQEPLLGIAIGIKDEVVKSVAVKDGDTNYYRNEADEHCVPKLELKDVLLGTF